MSIKVDNHAYLRILIERQSRLELAKAVVDKRVSNWAITK